MKWGSDGHTAGQTVQSTGRGVEESVAAGPGRKKNQGVNKVGQTLDAKVVNANDPGTGGGTDTVTSNGVAEGLVGGAADNADAQDAEDIECNDAVKDEPRDTGDGVARVGNLTSGNDNQIRAGDSEGGVDADTPEAEEAASVAVVDVLNHNICSVPVAEAVGVMMGVATAHSDEGDHDEEDEEENLGRGHVELGLAVKANSNDVEQHADDHGHGDPRSSVDIRKPVLHPGSLA